MAAKKTISAIEDIVEWSANLPLWQRDALRRIVQDSQLGESDHKEVAQLCKHSFGIAETEIPVPEGRPVTETDLPSASMGKAVTLVSLSQVENVNVICPKQELTFGKDGMTVVFGYNGSGKSGYGRVLKKACRARKKGTPILPNVLLQGAAGPASAEVCYLLDGQEQAPEQWIDGVRQIDRLGSVSFFDAECGLAHVGEKNNIAFMPFGLDVLPKLGQVCKKIQATLEQEKRRLETLQPEFLRTNKTRPDTKAGKLLRSLNADLNPLDLNQLAGLQPEETQRMRNLRTELASDPKKMADNLRTRARRIADLAQIMEDSNAALSDEKFDTVKKGETDYAAKKKAATVAADVLFANEPLANVGGDVWRELWEAARKYSATVAYPNDTFPKINKGAKCVLCQQALEPEAAARLARFEKFVRDNTAAMAEQAEATLANLVKIPNSLRLHDNVVTELLAEVKDENPETLKMTRRSLAALKLRCRWLKRAVNTGSWSSPKPAMIDSATALRLIVASLEKRANEIAAAVDKSHRAKLVNELAELEDRDWLGTVVGDVKIELDRLRKIAAFGRCIAHTRTTAITTKSKALANQYVTEQLRRAFAEELKALQQGVHRISVELAGTSGEYGTSLYQVQLVGATDAPVDDVASEGEHRCIALAGFLAELSTQQERSCIIFDDPVTSLDHRWRQSFARRLVEEAKNRQVIVFTHDIVFLHDVIDACDQFAVPKHIRRVDADRNRAGVVNESLPWIALKISERIDALEKEGRAAQKLFDAAKDDDYSNAVGRIYSSLRAAVERAIEERLFRGVLLRHRDWINVVYLHEVAVLTRADCQLFQALHKRCCDITDAHDHSAIRSLGVPNPSDMLKDIQQLLDLVEDIRKRQIAISKT